MTGCDTVPAQAGQPGVLDETLPRTLAVLDEHLFGLAGEDQATAPAAGREAKRNRGADTFALLAQGTSFARLHDVLGLVRLPAGMRTLLALGTSFARLPDMLGLVHPSCLRVHAPQFPGLCGALPSPPLTQPGGQQTTAALHNILHRIAVQCGGLWCSAGPACSQALHKWVTLMICAGLGAPA